jgi:uncharacterized membrane protein
MRHLNRNTKAIAAIAIFSALYAALRIIPTVPMIGTGATFHLSDILAPLFGILLGPYVGGVSIIIGTFAAIGLGTPAPFLGLDFLPAFVVAVSLGFLVRRKWLPVVILNALLLVGYALNPFTVNFISTPWGAVPYLWMHIVAFIVLLSPLGHKAGEWIKADPSSKKENLTSKFVATLAGGLVGLIVGAILLIFALLSPEPFTLLSLKTLSGAIGVLSIISGAGLLIFKARIAKITIGFAILAFVGTMMQHLTGGLVYETVFGNIIGSMDKAAFANTWNFVFYIYPWERLALIIGAIIVGVPVTRILMKTLFPLESKPVSETKPDASTLE